MARILQLEKIFLLRETEQVTINTTKNSVKSLALRKAALHNATKQQLWSRESFRMEIGTVKSKRMILQLLRQLHKRWATFNASVKLPKEISITPK